jgi:hypothetical protein
MYLGKWGTGILKLITFGGFGLWVIVDLILIMSGMMRDRQGREMLQFSEYKAFSYKLVLIFAITLGIVVLIKGLLLIAAVTQFITDMQNGTMTIPGLDALQGGGLTPEQRTEFGL